MTEHDAILVPAFELAELRRDAERWRWFRKLDRFGITDLASGAFIDAPHEMDAAIDAAMQANK
jgi:hypothetical protein